MIAELATIPMNPMSHFAPTMAAARAGDASSSGADSPIPLRSPDVDDGYRGIRFCIWVYFFLLIFEGSLRKWVLPGSSNLLLVVRDPVVAVCYFIALRNGKFPKGPFVLSALILGIACLVTSFAVNALKNGQNMFLITGFGFHANFFHLPVIFLIRDAFDRRRLRAIGKWVLWIAPFTAVLIFLQYRSSGEAWVNHGAGKDAGQLWVGVGGLDKVRPAGFFSYNTGNAAYLSWVAAFLLNAILIRTNVISRKTVIISAIALASAGSLSISRTCAMSIVVVFAAGTFCMMLAPKLANRSVLIAFLAGALCLLASRFSVFGEAIGILQQRVEDAGGIRQGGVARFLDGFAEPFRVLEKAESLGIGLGMGTNAAGGLLTGERQFMAGTENEWARHFLESGMVLGGLYILWRIALVIQLLRVSLKALRTLNPLPMLLFSSCALLVLIGPVGIPMTLGFVVMGAGMTLAAAKEVEMATDGDRVLMEVQQPQKRLVRGRSPYAEQLHAGRKA